MQRLAILAERRQDKDKQHYEKEEHRVIASAQALIHKETCKSIFDQDKNISVYWFDIGVICPS